MYFNEQCHREYYSNQDYIKVGGRKEDFPSAYLKDEDDLNAVNDNSEGIEQPELASFEDNHGGPQH